jgi:acetyl-CoA hydrolase
VFKDIALDRLDFARLIRPGDTVAWGEAGAEPLALTNAVMAQRHAICRFGVFLGATYSAVSNPEYADCVSFSANGRTGANRMLAKAGKLDILPCHYSQLPGLIHSGRLKIDVLLLQLAPSDEDGNYLSVAHEYLVAALDSARIVIAEINEQRGLTVNGQSAN